MYLFCFQDTQALQARQDQLSVQREEEEAKRERLEKLRGTVVVRVDRDPSRLLKPTSVWEERQKGGGEGPAMPLLSIPKRYMYCHFIWREILIHFCTALFLIEPPLPGDKTCKRPREKNQHTDHLR